MVGALGAVPQRFLPRVQRGHVLTERALPCGLYCCSQPLDGVLDRAPFLLVVFASNAVGEKAAALGKVIDRPAKLVRFKGMIERRMSTKNLTGPIGMGSMAGEAAREGPSAFFLLMSTVSLNLAIFNLLPIPILDGGVILMLLVEMTMQRDLSLNVKEAVFKVGFVCIMAIVAFVLYNDISKMLPG